MYKSLLLSIHVIVALLPTVITSATFNLRDLPAPNPSYQPHEVLRLSEYSPFEGIPHSKRSGLKYIEISQRIFDSASQLMDALEGCINLEELYLDRLVRRTNDGRYNESLDFGSRRVYLPALLNYTIHTKSNQPLRESFQLEALLPFYKNKPDWNITEIQTLGVNIVIYDSWYKSFEFGYEEHQILGRDLHCLGEILCGCCNENSNFTLRSLFISSSDPTAPPPTILPSCLLVTLFELHLYTLFVLQQNIVKAILLRTQSLKYLYLQLNNLANKEDRIDIDIAWLPNDTMQELELINVNLQLSIPNQFKVLKSLKLEVCIYNASFIELFDSTFHYVDEVMIWNDKSPEDPWRDQQLLTKLFKTKAKYIKYSPFDFHAISAYFNFTLSHYQFLAELGQEGQIYSNGALKVSHREKFIEWPLKVSSTASRMTTLRYITMALIIKPVLYFFIIY